MVSPEAVTECSKDAPVKPVTSQYCSTVTRVDSSTPGTAEYSVVTSPTPAENGNVNDCPIQIKVFRDQDVKQPSYVSLARCISGYTLLTTYDSKQREGFRSRDISPARVPVILNTHHTSNGQVGSICPPMVTTLPSPQSLPTSKLIQTSPSMTDNMDSKNFGSVNSETQSFVLQRVERIFGPGALAQGFYTRNRIRSTLHTQEECVESNNNVSVPNSNEDSLPVLKLLRPEFRAQLSVARHRTRNFSKDTTDAAPPSSHKEYKIPITLEGVKEKVESPVQVKNGQYYLEVVHKEMEILERLAGDLRAELAAGSVPEELEGEILSVIGKARLLVAEKLRQFEGLCHKNISQDPKDNFKTTNEDLAGFWDMVSIQVGSMHNEFDSIAKMRANNWKQTVQLTKKAPVSNGSKTGAVRKPRSINVITNGTSTPNGTSSNGNSNSMSKARDEARKRMLQERRMAMKRNLSAAANQDQVFTVDQNSI